MHLLGILGRSEPGSSDRQGLFGGRLQHADLPGTSGSEGAVLVTHAKKGPSRDLSGEDAEEFTS